jgi:hypothetical protein
MPELAVLSLQLQRSVETPPSLILTTRLSPTTTTELSSSPVFQTTMLNITRQVLIQTQDVRIFTAKPSTNKTFNRTIGGKIKR